MPYALRLTPSAKAALSRCFSIYHQEEEISAWLKNLVLLAEHKIDGGSIDLGDMLGEAGVKEIDLETLDPKDWNRSWGVFKDAQLRKKIAALFWVVSKRTPPIRIRNASETFVFLGVITLEISAFYEVNHVDKVVTFLTFEGLPGAGLPDI